jgi:hypothetical protein
MAAGFEARFAGLRQLDRALGMSNKALRKVLRDRLRDAAGIVVAESKALAEAKHLRRSGDMIASIRPFAAGASGRRSGSAGVQVTARHGGYAYPRRLEYQGRAGGPYGPLAFVNPAIEAKGDEIVADLARVLDDVEHVFGGNA